MARHSDGVNSLACFGVRIAPAKACGLAVNVIGPPPPITLVLSAEEKESIPNAWPLRVAEELLKSMVLITQYC